MPWYYGPATKPSLALAMLGETCSKTRSVIDSDSFLSGNYKNLQVFLAAYLWATKKPPKQIICETGLSKNTVTKLLSSWRNVVQAYEVSDKLPLGLNSGLGEVDETAIGKRKYQRRKRQRSSGTEWVQSMLEVNEGDDGKRKSKRVRLMLVRYRTAATLQSNIRASVDTDTAIQFTSIALRGAMGLSKGRLAL